MYPSYILYQAVKIFDTYMDRTAVQCEELQIIALASLWVALKKDLINYDIPSVSSEKLTEKICNI